MIINEKIDYLFSKINWGSSFLDAKAIQIMNSLKSDITTECKNSYNQALDDAAANADADFTAIDPDLEIIMNDYEEGVDYEISPMRASIVNLKKK